MKNLLILGFLIIQITLSASSFQNFIPRSDTIIKEDSTNFLPDEMFSYGEETVPLPEDAEIYNTTIAGNYCSWEEYVTRAHRAWDAVDSLEITQQFAAKPFHVGLYAYSRTEGEFDPVKADWIIFLYSGNEFPARVADLGHKKSFSILPNPATDRIKVEFYETLEVVEVDVLDIFGSVIRQTRNQPSSRQIVIPTSSWTPGVYILKVRSGDHVIGVKRVIKV